MTAAASDLDAALALATDDEPRARAALQALWQAADARGDTTAAWQVASAALIVITLSFVDFRGAAAWCARFAAGVPLAAAPPCDRARRGETSALRACAALLAWAMLDHQALAGPAAVAHQAAAADALAEGLRLETHLAPAERFMLVKCLLDHHGQQMDTLAATRLMALQHERLGAAPPALQAHWWFTAMVHHGYYGDAEAAQQARARLLALLARHEVPGLRFALATADMPAALKAGQMARAERLYRELEALMPDVCAGELPQGLRAQALYLSQRGDQHAALARIDQLLAVCRDVEVPARDQGAYHALRANVLAALGRFDEARAALVSQRPFQAGTQGEMVEVLLHFVEAAACLDSRPDAAQAWLAQALAGAARHHYNRFFLTVPALAARLCQVALEAGIEPEFVRAAIHDRHLPAPDPTRADWPWRVRLQVLGGLAVWRDGLPLRSPGKAQRKPLELLALLAAHGGGPLEAEFIIDALWPSLEADAPKASLEMAVSRLRKLLALPEAVQVADGAVALDPALVWCDAGAFEALAGQLAAQLAAGAPAPALAALATRTLALYRGPLLGNDRLGGRMQAARERLALHHHRAVAAWGAALEARGDWGGAIALYEQALAHDLLAEPLYRALMHAHLQRGERAEALRAWHRCCALLASVLGTEPNAATRALYEAARVEAG